MKFRYTAGALLAGLSLVLLAACGGGDEDDGGSASGIRTQKGLAVAAIAEGLAASDGQEADTAETAPVPAAERQTGGGAGFTTVGQDSAITKDSMRYGGAPLLQQSNNGVTVQGYGSATADADAAIVEFYFSRNGPVADISSGRTEPGFSGSGAEPAVPEIAPDAQDVAPITEADLQPVIDAIVGAGVPRENVQFVSQSYFDRFYTSATLRVTIDNVESVDAVVKAGNDAAAGLAGAGITVSGTNVAYTVNDCTALEEAAMNAAVEDARERGEVFARSLGVGIGGVSGASNYSYFGGTPCDPGFYPGPYPLGGITYAEGQPREVQVIANISVTYAIQ
jgi:uncharacterized protein YggE